MRISAYSLAKASSLIKLPGLPHGVEAQHAVLLLDVRAAMVLTSVAMMTIEDDAGMPKVTRTEGWHAAIA